MSDPKTLATHMHVAALSEGNYDLLDEHVADSFRAHFLAPETPAGPESLKDFCRAVRAVFPDLKYTIEDVVDSGDRVAVRVTGHGTQTGGIGDLPATQKAASWSEMHIFRIEGGKLVEVWGVVDQLSALQQLGGVSFRVPKLVVDSAAPTITIPDSVVELLADYANYGT